MAWYDGITSLLRESPNDQSNESREGVDSGLIARLEVKKSDEEILLAIKDLEQNWVSLSEMFKPKQDENERFWKGKQSPSGLNEYEPSFWEDKTSDNVIFESTETFLAEATKVNPEPVVSTLIKEEAAQKYCKTLKDILVNSADKSIMKLSLKQGVRFWNLYLLGVWKPFWNDAEKKLDVMAIRPQRIKLQKGTTIEKGVYTGTMLAEVKYSSAEELAEQFPKHKEYIKKQVDGKMASRISHIEAWTNEYVCWKYNDKLLGKMRNPNFNDVEEQSAINPETLMIETTEVEGFNHFLHAKHPYVFLSIFNLGKNPLDDTSLIEQTIPYQRNIDKTSEQIEMMVERMNGGYIADSSVMDENLAQQAVDALTNNDVVLAPKGSVEKIAGQGLPADVWNQRNDSRIRAKDVYGVSGLTSSGVRQENTVRGKIITGNRDGSRIGSGVVEYIEQVADAIFNQWVQLAYVYMTTEDLIRILGEERALEFEGHKEFMRDKEVLVSVKEGSLIPKDDLTRRNEAIDLWGAGAIDPMTFFEKLDYADPSEQAYKLFLWQNNPQQYFMEFGGKFAERMQPQQPPAPAGGQAQQPQVTDLSQPPPVDVMDQVPI